MPYSSNEKRRANHVLKREEINAYRRKYYKKNKDKISQQNSLWRLKNKNQVADRKRLYAIKNAEKISLYKKNYAETNWDRLKKYHREYRREKSKTDFQFYLKARLRSRLTHFIHKKGSSITDLGCSVEKLRRHLENQFLEGMSWKNRGEWHIDHIKPLASFDLTNRKQFLKACHYKNLRPLWAKDNREKSDKIY